MEIWGGFDIFYLYGKSRFTRAILEGWTACVSPYWRLTRPAFFRRRWLPPILSRMILPLPVI